MAQNQVLVGTLTGIMGDAEAGSLVSVTYIPYTARTGSPVDMTSFTPAVSVTPHAVASLGSPIQRPDGSIGFTQEMTFIGVDDVPNTCTGLVCYQGSESTGNVVTYSDFDNPYALNSSFNTLPVAWQLTLDLTNGNFGQVEVN